MNATLAARYMTDTPGSMSKGMIASLVFHGIIVGFIIFGFPMIHKPKPLPETAISIEVLEIAETRQSPKPPVEAPKPKEPPKPEELIARNEPVPKPPPPPPKVEAKEPPKAVPVKAPEPKPEPPKPKEVVKPEPKIPPPPEETLAEPEPDPPPPKEEEVAEQAPAEDQFASLLKNLQEAEAQPDVPDINPEAQNAEPSPLAEFGQTLTMSEFDALRMQLSRCWSIQAGARFAEDLVVEVRIQVDPNKRVIRSAVVDQMRYNSDSFFRAAADSAIRAVHSPMCDPLILPDGKYNIWKQMVINFDPRDML